MNSCQRSIVTRIHGLKHVERFASSALTHNYSIGPHAQRVSHKLPDWYSMQTLKVRWSRLQRNDMSLRKLYLSRVLNCNDSLSGWDKRRQRIQQSRLS